MKQHCHLFNVWLTWAGIPVLAVYMIIVQSWIAGAFVLFAGIVGQTLYVRYFPKISFLLGYGSVIDKPAEFIDNIQLKLPVTIYTANVCPFCPIVKKRLSELQKNMGFNLKEVDVTFHPDLITGKGFRSVPVVEYDGRFWNGNATSAQLAAFLVNEQTSWLP
jgi:glutaredoxin